LHVFRSGEAMKVGDLVTQIGLWRTGVGIVTKVWGHRGDGEPAYATVHWADGMVDMSPIDLEIVSESR